MAQAMNKKNHFQNPYKGKTDVWTTSFFLLLFLLSVKGIAQDGALDISFGINGKVLTPIGPSDDTANAVALQPDGKILVAGSSYTGSGYSLGVVRYNPDGSLDDAFGDSGKVITNLSSEEDLNAIALQSDGKIVVAGFVTVNNYSKFLMLRYLSSGAPDTAFGNFGNVVTPIGNFNSRARAMVIQPDGKIVLAGRASVGSYDDFAAARYNPDGSIDQTFGNAGIVTTPIGTNSDTAYSVALQNDGKIVVGGTTYNGTNYDFAIVRFNAGGSLDDTFDSDGKVSTGFDSNNDTILAVAIQDDGKIVGAGVSGIYPGTDFALARYNPDGSLDMDFGSAGKVVTAFGPYDDSAYGVALQSDGKIVAAGYRAASVNNNKDFAVARYNADGALDDTFGTGGMVITPVANSNDVASGVAIQDDGKIVVAGASYNVSDTDFAVVRYNAGLLASVSFKGIDRITVSPNPAHPDSKLNFNASLDDVTVIFTNALGQQVKKADHFSGESINIEGAAFTSGFYLMQISKGNEIVAEIKLIVTD